MSGEPVSVDGGGAGPSIDGPGSAPASRILDRGYRRYDGPRRGAGGAVRSLMVQTTQRALGIHRSAWAKLVPIVVIAMAYVPAIVFIGITVLAKQQTGGTARFQPLLPSYAQYYGFVTAAIGIFAAFVAPEVLCTDRRSRMLGLYLASPLTRTTYLLAKFAAVAIMLSVVTIGPPLLMVLAYTLNGFGPSGFGDFVVLLGRVLLAGLTVTMLWTALSMAISATTTRKAAATAAIIIVLLGSAIATDLVISVGRGSRSWFFLNVLQLPFELVVRIYGDPVHSPRYTRFLDTVPMTAAYLGWTLLCVAFVAWRYQKVEVTR